MTRRLLMIAGAVTMLLCQAVSAKDVFVDNLAGEDEFDGLLDHTIDSGSGPVRTLRRAMQIAGNGDQIVLTRPGAVYFDSLSLTGRRHSGSKNFPFTINGNGATLSGLRMVPREGWRQAGPDLWKLTLTRKGYYRLARNGQPLPEFRPENLGANPFAELPPGQWSAWQGSVYFKSDGEPPATQAFSYAAEQTGLSLYQVENVRIVDLTLRDFRFDGINAQNMCSGVKLENVNCFNNGRAGIAVGGSSHIAVIGGKIAGNGRQQVRISNVATADLQDVTMDGEPTLIP